MQENQCWIQNFMQKCQVAYIGETGENMYTQMKSHLTKFYSKTKHISESSAFIKHLSNSHGGFEKGRVFEEYFDIKLVKSYKKNPHQIC